jgi:predicted GH43/DUF377 family glycosyl hydrolase
MNPFEMHRLWPIMAPEPGNPQEVEGVLNPAAVRGADGHLYLFPRLVGRGNYSRIGIARVLFNADGDPCGVERLGIALQPEADYEKRADGGGGCEDPRITFVEPLREYVMTYTAFSPSGPRIALAVSDDLLHWHRLGLAEFGPYQGIELDGVDNKDATLFPVFVPNPSGVPELAMLHRPIFAGAHGKSAAHRSPSTEDDLDHQSIWISYSRTHRPSDGSHRLAPFTSHHRLAAPVSSWEQLKIGVGTPPVLTRLGWLVIYHGVSDRLEPTGGAHGLCYSAGLMVLSADHPRRISYRSAAPILTPELPQERQGTIANVVFPTGIDRRDDLGRPDRFDVYYGMADDRIGVARLDLPERLPAAGTMA